MSKSTYTSLIATALMVVICGVWSPAAHARQDNDLQQENLELKRQVADLERQLAAANNTITELQRRDDRLTQALQQSNADGGATATDPPKTDVTIDESIPGASPRALMAALQADYETAMAEVPMGEPGGRDRTTYLRTVEHWVAAANRKYRTKIVWHIKPFQPPTGARPTALNFVAVDPVTHAELGKPFAVSLSRIHQRRLESLENRSGLDVIVMKGVLVPQLKFNGKAASPGTFDRPILVGPFAEFRFAIEPSSFTAVAEVADETDAG